MAKVRGERATTKTEARNRGVIISSGVGADEKEGDGAKKIAGEVEDGRRGMVVSFRSLLKATTSSDILFTTLQLERSHWM